MIFLKTAYGSANYPGSEVILELLICGYVASVGGVVPGVLVESEVVVV